MDFNAIAKIIADRTSCDVSSMKSKSTFTEPVIDSLNIVDQLKNLEGELNEFIRDDMKTSPLVSNSNHCFLCQTVPSYRKKFPYTA